MKSKLKVDMRMVELKEIKAQEIRREIKNKAIDQEYGLELALDEAHEINFYNNSWANVVNKDY